MDKIDSRIKEIQEIELEMLLEMDKISKENNLTYYLAYGTALGAVRHNGFIPWDSDVDIMVTMDKYDEFCDIMSKKLPNKYFIYSIKNDDSYEELHARIGLRNELHLSKHVDIFPMVGAPKKGFKRRFFSKLSYINHRCYFIKKVNININYKNRPKRRIQARILKLVLLPFNSKIFISIFNRLGKLYPIDKSETVYSICGLDSEIDFIPLEYLDDPEYFKFEDLNLPMPKEWDKYLKKIYGDYMTPRKENYYNK